MQEDAPVIIAGAGPIGMILAYQLDRLKVPCLIAEQNLETTKWPKMDLTNARSMELLRYLGLANDYRAQAGAVPRTERFDSQFVTQINSKGKLLSTWVGVPSCHLIQFD
jgi:FAD-dependent monooxygenase